MHDDGTTSNEDRLGAIGDMQFVIERAGIDDDLLVIAGDNLFEFSLVGLRRASGASKGDGERDRRARRRHARARARATASSTLDDDGRVSTSSRSRSDPPSTLAATATYLFHRDARPARPHVSRRRESARPARRLRRLAARARARLRLALRRGLVRHRRPRAAARGGQPLPRRAGPARARDRTRPDVVTHLAQRRAQTRHAVARSVGRVARRPPPAAPLRLLWWACPHALLWLPRARLRPLRPPRLRPLRRADGVAGRTLPRMRGPPARLRLGARRPSRTPGLRTRARARLEGARPPPARSLCRRARRRARRAAGGGRHHVYPARPRPQLEARPPPGRGARP